MSVLTADDLLQSVRNEFVRRKFVAGLSIAFIRFLRTVGGAGQGYESFDAFLIDFPRQMVTTTGATANTLLILPPGSAKPVSLRPFYNDAERLFRADHKRFDYPNCAPHATQAWTDYISWLDSLLQLSGDELDRLESRIIAFVLEILPSHAVDTENLEPLEQQFTQLLQDFEMSAQQGEKQGAAFQGAIYAFIRADAPHLHLDIAKVGAGSKRLQRVGDIDGWDGERLVLSVEVKHFTLTRNDVPDIAAFANQVMARKAMGIIAADAFGEGARADLEGMGLRTLDMDGLIDRVFLWDPIKQRAALAAFAYYAHHIEKNMPLILRLRQFTESPMKAPSSPAAIPPDLQLSLAGDDVFDEDFDEAPEEAPVDREDVSSISADSAPLPAPSSPLALALEFD